VFSAIQDVAGQAAERQMSAAYKHENQAGDDYNSANNHQQFAEICHEEIVQRVT
jgi:hypothetical protein